MHPYLTVLLPLNLNAQLLMLACPACAEFQTEDAKAAAGEVASRAAAAGGHGQQGEGAAQKQPAAAVKPSEMIISRTGLFYCATFPRRPGLPNSRARSGAPP
jgi:hypothetical protein